ncbi:alpha-galactosidase [bacterium]|nr:alpha-galactosidase [bacterium]
MTIPTFSRCVFLLAIYPIVIQAETFPSVAELPMAPTRSLARERDWLLETKPAESAAVHRSTDGNEISLDNGLVRRTLRLKPNGATVAFDDLRTGSSLLRAVRPEALVTINGKEWKIGGLLGQKDQGYLAADEADRLVADPASFQLASITLASPLKPFDWKRTRHASLNAWPPRGAGVVMEYAGTSQEVDGIRVLVRYEIYDGIPAMAKSLEIRNDSNRPIMIDSLAVEVLAAVEGESAVDSRDPGQWRRPPIDVISDYMFHGMDQDTANRAAHWLADPEFTTQVSYELRTPCLLVCRPPIGPAQTLAPGESLKSFRVILIVQDSTEQERRGLTLRRTWRTVAPWVTENPLMMHVRHSGRDRFRLAVDQCAEVGFEMIIYTFGSGLEMERSDPSYLQKIKEDVDYAHAKGIQVGGYSLFSSRKISDTDDVIDPSTGKPGGTIFGNAPCLGSVWGQNYQKQIRAFIEATGFDLLEHDGPYPGDLCASTQHPGHRGTADSQWTQWQASRDLYAWCREHGVYVNQPDCYFLCGGSKTGMGYRETNWSLPRAQQFIHARQNIYDGTWNKTPTMGWMFVPLTEYHGGGKEATLEPLRQHLQDYERHLTNCLGAGVQACYRGPRLFDADETKALVAKWVTWFKKYRAILESDIIHGRRADGRDIDYIIHANPSLRERALAVIYNPLSTPVTRKMKLPLYYTGLSEVARIRVEEGPGQSFPLDRQSNATIDVSVPAMGMTWLVVESNEE